METIGNLSGNFAHDFNNLMQVLTGAVELLINDRESPRDSSLINRMESVVGIALATGRSTIAQLLAYSKNRDLYPVPIHIGDYLKETEPLIRSLTGESVDLKIVDSSAGASILADTSQLTGAILNLVKNAKEAIELSDGRIEIVVEPSPAIAGSKSTSLDDLNVLIVEDNDGVALTISTVLENETMNCLVVDSSTKAMQYLTDGHGFDLILHDADVPGKYSLEQNAAYLETAHPSTKLKAMSGHLDLSQRQYPVIRKPFSSEELVQFLAEED